MEQGGLIMSRKKQKIYCVISMVLLVCFMCFNYSQMAFALESTGIIRNAFTWSIDDDVMTLQSTDGNWTATLKSNNCFVDGEELKSTEVSDEIWDTDESKPFLEWLSKHSMNTIELHVGALYSSVGNDRYMRDITDLIIGEEVRLICDNAFTKAVQLKQVLIYSRDIDLTKTGIGYFSENEKSEDMIIYGYIGSTAENYANENGFTFIALEDDSDTMATTTTSTSTDTTITTTTHSMETTTETATTSVMESNITTIKSTTTSTTTTATNNENTSVSTETITSSTTTSTKNIMSDTTTETTTTATTRIASDEELCDWAAKDYAEKTGITPENAEIEYIADGNAVITLTDAEGSVLDVYNIDPFTGIGAEADGGDVNLPQTGYSNFYKVIVWFAILMTISGVVIVVYSRKESE